MPKFTHAMVAMFALTTSAVADDRATSANVELISKNLTIYHLSSKECALEKHAKFNQIMALLMKVDYPSFKVGSATGATLFGAALALKKTGLCETAIKSRGSLEASFADLERGLNAVVQSRAGSTAKP